MSEVHTLFPRAGGDPEPDVRRLMISGSRLEFTLNSIGGRERGEYDILNSRPSEALSRGLHQDKALEAESGPGSLLRSPGNSAF